MPTNEKIALLFYKEYRRSPKKYEFEALGGSIHYVNLLYAKKDYRTGYRAFIKDIGLPYMFTKADTVEIINTRRNKIEYVGVPSDVAKYYGVHSGTINRHVRNKTIFKEIYTIRVKKFNKKKMLDIIHNASDSDAEKVKEMLKNEKFN